jgi:hypothetical protein
MKYSTRGSSSTCLVSFERARESEKNNLGWRVSRVSERAKEKETLRAERERIM